MFEFLSKFSENHDKLKKRIHAFRIPLSPTGRRIMGFVYFAIPMLVGYQIMTWTNSTASNNLKGLKAESSTHKKETKQQNESLKEFLKQHGDKPM